MITHLRRFLCLSAVVLLLSSCGGKATPGPELPTANASPVASAVLSTVSPIPSPTAAPSHTPTVAGTLPPAAPMPGLVYTRGSNGAGYQGLWIVQADGQPKQLSAKTDPRLSPDQTQALYFEKGDVWLENFATSKSINLTHTRNRIEAYYQWWPARPGVVVFQFQPSDNIQPMGGYLATVKTNGENYLVLDEEVGSDSPAAVSSDGQTIAFDRGGQPWVYNLSGGSMPIMPKSFQEKFRLAVNPAWSPDGRKLAWQLFGDQAGTDGLSAVVLLDLDTFSVTLLHRYTLLGGGDIGFYHLAWSPDGKWLAVANQAERKEDGKVSLWAMRMDGSEEHPIGGGDRPVWSPDGQTLAYLADGGVNAAKAGEWKPYPVTVPADALVIDWVKNK
jgi:hypothetical protein